MPESRSITTVFGLIGLYLALEKGYTGKDVQRAHMQIARLRKDWPRLESPGQPAGLTVMDVLAGRTWCRERRNDHAVGSGRVGELG